MTNELNTTERIVKNKKGHELITNLKDMGINTHDFENIFNMEKRFNLYRINNEYIINIYNIFYNISKDQI